jgi:hypothetical protein
VAGGAIGYVQHVNAGHHLEQLTAHVDRGSDAGRRHIELARMGFGIGKNSVTVLAGTEGLTTITSGSRLMLAIGAISRMKF